MSGSGKPMKIYGVSLMINLSLNVTASKPCGGVVLTRFSLLYSVLLAVAGISQTLAATLGDTPAEDARTAWHAVTLCGLVDGGPQRDTQAARFSDYSARSLGTGGAAHVSFEHNWAKEYLSASVDEYHLAVKDVFSLSVLGAQQSNDLTSLDYSASNSPAAAVSDDATHGLIARYDLTPPMMYVGYESIRYADPSVTLPADFNEISAYISSGVTYYDFKQYGYQSGTEAGSAGADSKACADKLDEYSLTKVDWTKPFDAYAGSAHMYESHRLKYGYVSTTNVNSTIGVRLSF
jgi:hypothetical protein